MIVQPPNHVQASIAAQIKKSKMKEGISALDEPKIAAKSLVSKKELALFYGKKPDAEVTGWVVAAAQAVVAATAVVAAVLLKGAALDVQHPLNLQNNNVSNLHVDQLLNVRKTVITR